MILTSNGPQTPGSNARNFAQTKSKSTHIPDDWDDDDEEEETDSQKVWETAYLFSVPTSFVGSY